MYSDFNSMIYGEDGENPIRPTILRCINQAKEDGQRLRVEIRTKALGTTTTRQEHVFAVDAVEAHVDTIMSSICERLNSSPGEGFEGECRVNFYQSGNTTVKYGSYTRKIKNYESNFEEPQRQNFMNPAMMGMTGMNQNNQTQNPYGGFQNDEDPFGNLDNGEEEYGEQHEAPETGGQTNQMNHMMQMMMQMQQQNAGANQSNPYNIVDQKMAMDWLNHCMSFLFRSLTQQMAMFERSTKMIEIYSMRFGLPQPLERPSPERIIREVPMDFPQTPAAPEPSGLGILPALLQAAASLTNSPGAANMLKTAGSLAAGVGQKPTHSPPPPQQIAPQRPQKPRTRVEKMGKPAKYKKNAPTQHAEPVNDVDEFGWEGQEETPPMRMGPQSDEGYMFGLDGNSRTPINPFESEPAFQDELDEGLGTEDTEVAEEDALGLDLQLDGDIELPEDFPDLNGMTAAEMKETVINWINADPENRKGQILEMLPELGSLIV
jgi:hypothetical protein